MEQDLVVGAQRGDQRAFERLTAAHHPRLFRVAYGSLRDRHLAEDATQEAFIDIWRTIRRLRDPSKFEAWSYRLLVRRCYVEAKRRTPAVLDELGMSSEERVIRDDFATVIDRDQLDRGFRRLSLEHRRVYGEEMRSGTAEVVDGVLENRGYAERAFDNDSPSDPRLRGNLSLAFNTNRYGASGGISVDSIAIRIENEEGAWQQMPMVSPVFPGEDSKNEVGVFVGEGAYEGLIAVVRIATRDITSTNGGWELHGYIFDGELPPAPEPVLSE
jgi:RNA polymerase sigma factor (sigma-70 family)